MQAGLISAPGSSDSLDQPVCLSKFYISGLACDLPPFTDPRIVDFAVYLAFYLLLGWNGNLQDPQNPLCFLSKSSQHIHYVKRILEIFPGTK